MPAPDEREAINRIIYDELCRGVIDAGSRALYREIIHRLEQQGAEGVILGCTEIPLLISKDDASIPLFDTSYLHAIAAADYAMMDI